MSADRKTVVLLPAAPFLLELHSERMVDAMLALKEAGFRVVQVTGHEHRYRIDDAQERPT